jgi:mRNA interferase RelE/StbE
MPWSIRWSDAAVRDLQRLERGVAQRVVSRLEQAAENPEHFFVRLVGSDDYKLRVGPYRLLAVLSHSEQAILVERVDHRSRVYERNR